MTFLHLLVTTETGSVYHIDGTRNRFKRVHMTEKSGYIRHNFEWQEYERITQFTMGLPLIIETKPLPESVEDTYARYVITSPVVKVFTVGGDYV